MSAPAVPAIPIPATPDAAPPASAAQPGACAACGGALLGEFCHACGERRLRPDEMTLRAFVRDVASEVADLDSRAARSLRALLTRPGLLTAEWVAGRRRAYLGPLKLFLAAFAAILLVGRLLTRPVSAESERALDASWAGGVVSAVASRLEIPQAEALQRLNATALSHLSWLSVFIPVGLAAVLALVFLRRRRGYVEHLVFAAHASAFFFILGMGMLLMQRLAGGDTRVGQVLGGMVIAAMWVYLWRAVARVYGDRGWGAALRAGLLVIGYNLAQGVAGLLALGTATLSMLYL